MSTPQRTSAVSQRGRPWLLGACALVAGCGVVAVVVAAGWWWLGRGDAQGREPVVEYVVDASARMALQAANGDSDRLTVARGALAEVIRPASPDVTAGLRVFGSGVAAACEDSDLVVPLGPANQAEIADRLLAVEPGPNSEAALAEGMLRAIQDLAAAQGRPTLVVVTGGADSCRPEAGPLLASEAERAGIELEFFVIGFQVSPAEAEALRGLVAAWPDGHYLPANDKEQLLALLRAIQSHIEAPNPQTVSAVLATARAIESTKAAPTVVVTVTSGPLEVTPTVTVRQATAEAGATEANSGAAETACDHQYFPLRAGATWTYADSAGQSLSLTVTEVEGDLEQATATVTRVFQGTQDTTTVSCSREGLRADSTWGDVAGFSWQWNFGPGWERPGASGVWLLPASQLVAGARWSCQSAYASSQGGTATRDLTLVVAGQEPVTLDGQRLDALRVDSTLGYEAGLDVSGSRSDWLVPGIGLVRWTATITTSGVTGSASYELQNYSIP